MTHGNFTSFVSEWGFKECPKPCAFTSHGAGVIYLYHFSTINGTLKFSFTPETILSFSNKNTNYYGVETAKTINQYYKLKCTYSHSGYQAGLTST